MKTYHLPSASVVVLGLLSVAGCSGSSVALPPDFASPTGNVKVTAVSIDGVSQTSQSDSGTLNLSANDLSLGTASGTLNNDRTNLTVTSGGTGTLTSTNASYARFFELNPTNGPRRTGVIGIDADRLPTNTAVYAGTGNMTIQDNLDVLDLNGTVTVTADFGNGTVDTEYSNLNGTRSPAFANPQAATNVGTVLVKGSRIAGTGFSGGTASIQSTQVNNGQPLSAQATTSLSGAFYGPNADEVGGAFVVDDLTTNAVSIRGAYIAD